MKIFGKVCIVTMVSGTAMRFICMAIPILCLQVAPRIA